MTMREALWLLFWCIGVLQATAETDFYLSIRCVGIGGHVVQQSHGWLNKQDMCVRVEAKP